MPSAYLDRVSNKALGEMLVDKGALSQEQVDEALEHSKATGVRLGEALISLGYLTRDALGYAISEQYGQRPMELQPSMVDLSLVSRFDYELLSAHTMLPLIDLGNELVVVVGDPNDQEGLTALAQTLPEHRITPQIGAPEQIRRCLDAIHAHLIHPPAERSATAPPVAATAELPELAARHLPAFTAPPAPRADDFLEWLLTLAAAHPDRDVLVRDHDNSLQVCLTPSVLPTGDGASTGLTEVARFPNQQSSTVRHAVAARSIPLEHTRGQAMRWVYPAIVEDKIYDFLLFLPVIQSNPLIVIRALEHIHRPVLDPPPVPLNTSLKAGQYTVVLYDESCSLENTLTQFIEENARDHQFLVSQQATRCVIPGAVAFPAPFTNIVSAVQATAATCVIFDHPVDYREASRLLTSTYPPPAVLVCAPLPTSGGGAGSMNPDVEELITRQGAQSVRMMDKPDTNTQPDDNSRGND